MENQRSLYSTIKVKRQSSDRTQTGTIANIYGNRSVRNFMPTGNSKLSPGIKIRTLCVINRSEDNNGSGNWCFTAVVNRGTVHCSNERIINYSSTRKKTRANGTTETRLVQTSDTQSQTLPPIGTCSYFRAYNLISLVVCYELFSRPQGNFKFWQLWENSFNYVPSRNSLNFEFKNWHSP